MIATLASSAPNNSEPLGADAVHVWHFAYRREQGRAPLLALLARYLGGTTDDIQLVIGAHGRPCLKPAKLVHASEATLDFNWSHSGNHAVVALARGVAPGIDLERRRERGNALPLAKRFFHPAEAAALAALPPGERSIAFLQLWTAKEAVLKATGRGIAFGLHRLCVEPGEPPRLTWFDGDDVAAWQLQRVLLDDAHLAALAWRGGARRVLIRALATSA